MNAHNFGQQTDNMTIEQFEAESLDERLVANFDGKINTWWCRFWTSFAASVVTVPANIREQLKKIAAKRMIGYKLTEREAAIWAIYGAAAK